MKKRHKKEKKNKQLKSIQEKYLYVTVFLTGAAVLVIEIMGTRVLAPYYGATIFVWSSLISATLGFLALGYIVGGKLADKHHDPKMLYYAIYAAGLALAIIIHIDTWILLITDIFGMRFGPLVASILLFSGPLFFLGMVAPFSVRLQTKLVGTVGQTAGNLYAIATTGSLVGALSVGFFFVPYFSLTGVFVSAGVLLMLISIGWLFFFKKEYVKVIWASILLVIAALLPYSNYSLQDNVKILYKETGFFGTLKIYQVASDIKCLLINNSSQSCWNYGTNLSAWPYTRYVRALERQFPEEEWPLDILVLGLGGGSVVKEWIPHGHNIDVVEINPRVLAVVDEQIGLPDEDDGVQYILNDARYYVRHSEKKYDIILIDTVIGDDVAIHLSTKEFFQDVKKILKPGGYFSVNAKGWLYEQELQPMVYNTLSSVFDHVKITGRRPEILASIIYYASDSPIEYAPMRNLIPFLSGPEIWDGKFALSTIGIMTDEYNPSHIMDIPAVLEGRRDTIQTFGKGIFLHDPNR